MAKTGQGGVGCRRPTGCLFEEARLGTHRLHLWLGENGSEVWVSRATPEPVAEARLAFQLVGPDGHD